MMTDKSASGTMYKRGLYRIEENERLTESVWRMTLEGDTQWITAPDNSSTSPSRGAIYGGRSRCATGTTSGSC